VIALLIIFLLAPIVPYSTSSGIALGASVELTAQTSMSYAIFQCGLVSNPHVSGSYLGSSISYVPFTGTRWVCGNSVSG
jgi:hypothetical protein